MSRLFHITLIVLAAIGLPVLLFFTFSNFLASPVAAGMGLLFVVVYGTLWLLLLRVNAAWPRAGLWWVISCLLWGAGVSFLVVVISGIPLMALMDNLGWTFVSASFGGAYPEEIIKAVGVAVILLSFRRLNRPWHGFLTGALIGLGFEVFENLLYGTFGAMMHPNSDLAGVLQIWGLRIVAGPGLHVIFTAFAGWGIGLAIFAAGRSLRWRWGTAIGWTLLAFALHFVWNLLWEEPIMQLINILVVAIIMYPLAIWLYLRCHRSARADEGQVEMTHLLTNTGELAEYRRRYPARVSAAERTAAEDGFEVPAPPSG